MQFVLTNREKNILQRCDLDVESLTKKIEHYLEKDVAKVPASIADETPSTSVAIERVMSRAINQCISSEREACEIGDVLAALMEEKESFGVKLLMQLGVDKLTLS